MEPASGLVLCRTAKHGSTSWANYLVRLYTRDNSTKKTQVPRPCPPQVWLRGLESRAYTTESKRAVLAALEEAGHSYTAFFVCRNPIARLLSVYNYLLDGRNNAKSYVSVRGAPSSGVGQARQVRLPGQETTLLAGIPPTGGKQQRGEEGRHRIPRYETNR